jgi:glycosyl transferase family 25
VHRGTPVPYLEVAPGHQLAVMLSRCTGSSAYLMNRRAATAYAQGLLPMSLPYDHVFDQGWRFGLKFRLVTPTPCGHDERSHPPSWRRRAPGASSTGRGGSQPMHIGWAMSGSRLLYGLRQAWLERRT